MRIITASVFITAFVCIQLFAQTNTNSSTQPLARQGHTLVCDKNHKASLLLGGYLLPETVLREEIWSWNGLDWKLIPRDHGPGARSLAGAVFDSKRNLLVFFGGYGIVNGNRYGDVWQWEGKNWEIKKTEK